MTSQLHFSKKEDIKLKQINFSEIQYVISELRSYFPKKKIYEDQRIDFDDGNGIGFKNDLEAIITQCIKKGMKPARISSNFVYTSPKGASKLVLLDVWLNYEKLEISVGGRNGVQSDIDWARSKATSVKSLLKPLAQGEVKQVTKNALPSIPVTGKQIFNKNNKKIISWDLVIAILTLLVLIVGWLSYKKLK